MCKAMGSNPKCQMCIRVSMIILLVFIVVQIILAVVKGVYTKNLVAADVMQAILKVAFDEQKLADLESMFGMIAFGVSMMTIAGVVCALFVLCAGKFCDSFMGGCCVKFAVFMSFVIFMVLAIIFILVGSSLTVVKEEFN